jgi:cytosine/adenosine deaminase-related metal-dependent hydrolase
MTPTVLHASWVVPGDAPPWADGAVVLAPDETIVDAGKAADVLPRHAGAKLKKIDGVLVPGLVNAHTHIELSALRGQVPGGHGFVSWATRLIGARSELAIEHELEAIAVALDELERAGTRAVGDVSNTLSTAVPLSRRGFGGSVFHEVFGLSREIALGRVQSLAAQVEQAVGEWPSGDLRYAPAPHTLYTTHPDAVRALLAEAARFGGPTTLHLLEHAGERAAIERGEGPVVDWIEQRMKMPTAGFTWPRRDVIAYATELGALGPGTLLVHLTEAQPADLERIAASGAPVVLCPRSNLFIETKLPPLLAMRAAGVAPALGTDSLASNASLDVLAEARALADRFPTVPAWELVAMATWNGARALGRSDLGRVAKGARPGLFFVEGAPASDPCQFLLANLRAPRHRVRTWGERAKTSREGQP